MTDFLLQNGLWVALGCAVVGLLAAIWLVGGILRQSTGNDRVKEIAKAIQLGAAAYLNRQVVTIGVIALALLIAVALLLGKAMAIGFLLGAVCSLIAGYIGMNVAVRSNSRTAVAAQNGGRLPALHVAFNGGAVTGLLVVALALLSVGLFYGIASHYLEQEKVVRSLIGLALGASLISVFARLGGGIYTKAADVGADLVGKVESGLDEDDPKNPATIADNVGDNVGDCAGMAADVFETYAVSLIGAVVIGTLTAAGQATAAVMFPFLICGVSVVGALLGIGYTNVAKGDTTKTLVGAVLISSAFTAAVCWPIAGWLFPAGLTIGTTVVSAAQLYCAALTGIVVTILVVLITNYYTSTEYNPVRRIAKASESGHATNIIAGIGVGFRSTALPVLLIAAAIAASYSCGGLYGIAIAVVAMLSLSGIVIGLDAFGPITDNAGGIAAMSGMDPGVRKITDELDAVGNTMKAVTKGYAIASAGLAALVLFGSYVEELQHHLFHKGQTAVQIFDLMDHRVVIGLFLGGLIPYLFSGYTMDAVGKAAQAVVSEVRRQIAAKPGILKGTETPEYGACVDIVTKAALREMIIPALLPIIVVLAVAAIPALGAVGLGGVLAGSIVTGLFLAISMTSSGGAWDNAKKYIEDGAHGGKNSEAHKASVTGDTVGDPYKDTAGPAINPIIKVVNIVAILIIPLFF